MSYSNFKKEEENKMNFEGAYLVDISKHYGVMDDFVCNALQSNFCSFTLKFIGD